MNDERLGNEIGEFYRGTDVAPPDSKESARQVSSRLAQAPQVKRRRWLPSWLHRSPARAGHDQVPDGPTPDVTGRTRSMMTPTALVTAGALVFAVGGALLIAQPFDQQRTVPGASVEVEPAWVTGTVRFADSCSDVETDTRAYAARQSDLLCAPQTWASSDPRLGGPATSIYSESVYVGDEAAETYSVYSAAWNIRGESGGWRCANPHGLIAGEGIMTIAFQSHERLTCVGYGDNEGLSAVLKADWSTGSNFTDRATFEGLIFPGEVPPVPDATTPLVDVGR